MKYSDSPVFIFVKYTCFLSLLLKDKNAPKALLLRLAKFLRLRIDFILGLDFILGWVHCSAKVKGSHQSCSPCSVENTKTNLRVWVFECTIINTETVI